MNNLGDSGMDAAMGCFVAILVIVVCALLFALPVMWLWNWLMPVLFKLPTITWIQALGLNVLCGLLFKGNTTNVNK